MAVRSYVLAGCDPAPLASGEVMQEGVLPGTVGDELARFLDDLTIAGYSPATVKVYGYKLRKRLPLDWPLRDLTTALLRSLVAAEVRYAKIGTAATFDTMLRSFSKWLWKQQLTATNLMQMVPSPKPPEPETKALSQEALARLWQAAVELGPPYPLLFLMLRDTGMRRAEVAGCRWEDIEGDTLRVLGKGRKWRRVLLTEEVRALLRESQTVRTRTHRQNERMSRTRIGNSSPHSRTGACSSPASGHSSQDDSPLADATTRGPIFGVSPSRIGQLFAHIAHRAGVRCSCHSLRHTWATEFLRAGGLMEAARILGGWSSMQQLTTRYSKSVMEDVAISEARRLARLSFVPPDDEHLPENR